MLSVPSRRVAALAVAGTGLAVVLSGAFAPTATAAPVAATTVSAPAAAKATWFVDPRTPAERRAEVAVPKNPKKYAGPVRETRAVYRTKAGRLAVPMRDAFGNRMVRGQAVTLDGNGLFVINTTKLTPAARTQIARLSASLADASTVRCEGYADYAGTAAWNRTLASRRAAAVCDLLVASLPGLRATTTSYGPSWPSVLGGTSEDRRLNRRVVVEMTGTRPAKPLPPAEPTLKVPGPPVLDEVQGSLGVIYYRFTKPADDGGSPVTGYEVSTGDGWQPVGEGLPRAAVGQPRKGCLTTCYDGLEGMLFDQPAGVSQDLRVRAVNLVGAGAPSNTLSASAYGVPGAPTDLTVTGGDASLSTTFAAPLKDGGSAVLGYEISLDGGESWAPVAESAWTVLTEDLHNGTEYDVRVRAWNAWGYGPAATATALAATVPDAPWLEGQVVTVGPNADLAFTSPQLDEGTDGGSPITGYQISLDGGQTWGPFTYRADPSDEGVFYFSMTDLTIGTEYSVSLRAVNARGPGAASKTRSFTPAYAPDQPTDVGATADGTTVTVDFDAPSYDGGAEITRYELKVDDGDWTPIALDSSGYTITLVNQVAGTHVYQVRAVNRVGASAPGTSPSVVVTAPVPGAPTIDFFGYNGFSGDWQVYFEAGASNGATVTGYQVSLEGGPWITAASYTSSYASFPCADGGCGWQEGVTPIRLRAVSTGGYSPPSATHTPHGMP